MEALIHLCRKDFAFARHALLGSWAVFLVASLMPLFITGALVEAAAPILGLLQAAQYFQIFAATLKILRADSFNDGISFIGTRPVGKTTLWLSKLLSIAAFVLVPLLVVNGFGVLLLRVQLTPTDWLLYLVETTLVFGIPASIAWIVGTHVRQFVGSTLLTIVLVWLMACLAGIIFNRPGVFQFLAEGGLLKASQWLLAQALVFIAGPLLAWHFITSRSPVRKAGVWVITVAAVAVAASRWQWNFASQLALSAPADVPSANQLHITWLDAPRVSGIARNSDSFVTVVRGARVDGAPEAWLAYPMAMRSQIRFRDGSLVASERVNSPYYGDTSKALIPSLGIQLPMDHPLAGEQWRDSVWFEGDTKELRKHSDKSPTITGEALVELYQPVILANLQARNGESAVSGRFRYWIECVEPLPNGEISVEITATGASLLSLGDRKTRYNEIEVLIVNPRTRQHTKIGHKSGRSGSAFGWWFQRNQIPIEGSLADKKVDPVDFLRDARLYLMDRRYRGTVHVPFEIPEIVLEPRR